MVFEGIPVIRSEESKLEVYEPCNGTYGKSTYALWGLCQLPSLGSDSLQ
jgi:hypothetical protein